jgi:hypothetical protein
MLLPLSPRERLRAAFHEAAHAVIGISLYAPFSSLVVGRDEASGTSGRMFVPNRKYDPWKEALIRLAGPVGEGKFAHENVLAVIEQFGRTDILKAARALERAAPPRPTLAAAITAVGELVAAHWPQIEEVARELAKRGALNLLEVQELLRRQQARWDWKSPKWT